MASAVLVGVNPVFGLYASAIGPIGGSVGQTALNLTAGARSRWGTMAGHLAETLRRTGGVEVDGPVRVVPATNRIGESTLAAYEAGTAWSVRHRAG